MKSRHQATISEALLLLDLTADLLMELRCDGKSEVDLCDALRLLGRIEGRLGDHRQILVSHRALKSSLLKVLRTAPSQKKAKNLLTHQPRL